MMTPAKLLERTWPTESGCLEWAGSRHPSRGHKLWYGSVLFCGKTWRAHRLSYVFFLGAIPDGFMVCHSCDNGLCINPDHLFLGTAADNVHDAMKKGRQVNPPICRRKAKLTNAEVRSIAPSYLAGEGTESIARRLNVDPASVRYWLKRDGCHMPRARKPLRKLTDTSIEQIVAAYQHGAAIKVIARSHQVAPAAIRYHLRRAGAYDRAL